MNVAPNDRLANRPGAIFHLAHAADWSAAQSSGRYRAPSLDTEGFIHCSTRDQVVATANRHYRGTRGLLLLTIDPARLEAELVYEDTSGRGEDYPHVYGPINTTAIEQVSPFEPDTSGEFSSSLLPGGRTPRS